MENAANLSAHYQSLAELHIAKAGEALLPQVRDRLLSSADRFTSMASEYARFSGVNVVNRIDYIY
jgi:hypothetical protein